ncbi:hypothetical protein CCMSSC00406_0009418 [Pleurotus cornucopiae]|uniref:Uncharacterized protein n=1 Tax=Pleurotus cornucopiae TaxID=5321 RepID=A0ACB7ISR4_PLECO|nr:hypothetical protein CCMSSC00406_0009418 [Pleurotus cornucopiae]
MAVLGITLLSCSLTAVVYLLYRRFSRISLAHIRGPPVGSFLLGNLPELFQSEAGTVDLKWQRSYGDVVRIKGFMGEDRLLVSDPKALQYIYQTSGYHWPKVPERRELSRIITGQGLTWAEADVHKRQRKIMLPGFGFPESRAFLPIFFACANKLSEKWKDKLSGIPEGSTTLNMPYWLSRAALDAIGEAAFDYQFGAIDNEENDLAKAYNGLLTATFGSPSHVFLFTISAWGRLPSWLRNLWQRSSKQLDHARETERVGNNVAKSLVESKTEELLQGRGSKDIMSLLVRSNASENEKAKMTDTEMLAQMRTIMLAGHETTANSLSWILLELSEHPEMQHRLRREIRNAEANIRNQGRAHFEVSDFDNMPYTTAVIKEGLRLHPAVLHTFRQAGRDDVLPLSTPLETSDGKILTELPVPKGLIVMASMIGYNANKHVFGEDADDFNPERWLINSNEKKPTTVGVYGNILSFSAGVRSCIGWRFAVFELHAFLIEFISNFEFELTLEAKNVKRYPCLVVVPAIEGEEKKGAQLPLRVRAAARDD